MRKTKFFGLLLTFFLLIGISVGISAAFGEVNVTVSYNVDLVDGEPITIPQAHGSLFTHEAPADHGLGKIFKYWVVNGILRQDLNKVINIITRSSLNLKAVYGQEGKHIVTFIDSNGAYLKHEFVDGGSIATAPTAPNKPQAVFSGFVGLGTTANVSDPITMDTVFVATYTTSTVAGSLTVDGIVKPEVTINDLVTLEAPANFSHWVDGEGNILSYDPNYKFTMLVEDRIVNPVLGTPEVKPLVNMIAEPNLRTGYTSYVGQFEMPEGYELVEYGFIISRSLDALTVDSLGATVIPSNVYNNETNEFLRSFELDTYNSIRAYAVFNDGTKQVYEYSDKIYIAEIEVESEIFSHSFESLNVNESKEIEYPLKLQYNDKDYLFTGSKVYVSATSSDTSKSLKIGSSSVRGNIQTARVYQNISQINLRLQSWSGDNTQVKITLSNDSLIKELPLIQLTDNFDNYSVNIDQKSLGFNSNDILSVKIEGVNVKSRFFIDYIQIRGFSQNKAHEIISNVSGDENVHFVIDGRDFDYTPTKEGYTFNGWFTDVDLSIPFIGPVNQSLTLYAKFTVNSYTLSFNTDGGTTVDSINQPFGSEIITPADPTKEGYTFDGWSPALPATMPAGNQEFTALWIANDYTITFNTNGGDFIAPLTQAFGSTLSLPIPTLTGFNFDGWFTDDVLSVRFTGTTMPAEDFPLYAAWVDASSTSTVTFETNGGSSILPVTVINGQPVAKPVDPTKDGYTFAGWYSDEDFETKFIFTTPITSDITLYARWEGIPELEPITITLTESTIWSSKTNSYADGNFTKDFSGMTIKSSESGFYTGNSYEDNKIQVKKNTGWIFNTSIPEGYIIKSVTVNGQTSGKVNIYFSTNKAKPTTNGILGVSTSGDVSGNGYLYFYIKENNTQSGTVTIDSIVIELIPNP